MADRSWAPSAGRTYADYQARVVGTSRVLAALLRRASATPTPTPTPPPAPLPAPAAPGFVGHPGECRDKDGGFGTRLEHNGPINVSACEAMCASQQGKCQAYDWGAGSWCGIWGTSFTKADNVTVGGLRWTWATGPNAAANLPACKGAPADNTCYVRAELDCTGAAPTPAAPPVGCLAGCTQAQCFSGGL